MHIFDENSWIAFFKQVSNLEYLKFHIFKIQKKLEKELDIHIMHNLTAEQASSNQCK